MEARRGGSEDWSGMIVDEHEEMEQRVARQQDEWDQEDEEEEELVPRAPPTAPTRKRKREAPSAESVRERAVRARMDEALERRKLINRIKNWRTSLPDYVEPIVKELNLESMKKSDLEVLFAEIKNTVGSKTSSAISGQMSVGVVAMTQEALTELTPLKVDGPRVKLVDIMKTKEAQDLTKELALTFAEEIYTNPLYRAGAFLLNAVTQVHHINSLEASTPAAAPPPTATAPRPVVAVAPVAASPDGKRDAEGFELPQPLPPPTDPKQ